MFKNKKALILILINVVIWSFFVYRFYSAYTDYDAPVTDQNPGTYKTEDIKDSVVYKLSLDYKDPFLRDEPKNYIRTSHSASVSVKPKQQLVVVKTPTVVVKQLPEIKYLGLIKNSSSGVTTALISINGQSKLIKPNETVEGITFKSFDNNELIAFAGKEKLVVKK